MTTKVRLKMTVLAEYEAVIASKKQTKLIHDRSFYIDSGDDESLLYTIKVHEVQKKSGSYKEYWYISCELASDGIKKSYHPLQKIMVLDSKEKFPAIWRRTSDFVDIKTALWRLSLPDSKLVEILTDIHPTQYRADTIEQLCRYATGYDEFKKAWSEHQKEKAERKKEKHEKN